MKHLISALFALALLLPAAAFAADYAWAKEAIEATRWKDGGKVVGKAEANKRLEVLSKVDGKVRVRVEGSKFGWVDAALLSETDPTGDAAPAEAPAEEPAPE